jgi:predicted ATPase
MSFISQISLKTLPDSQEFPFCLELVKNFDELVFSTPVTILVGENGTGKSTLLEAIAWAIGLPTLGAEDIDVDYTMISAQKLGECLRLGWKQKTSRGFFFRSEDFFGFAKRLHQEILEMEADRKEIHDEFEEKGDVEKAKAVITGQINAFEDRYGRDLNENSHGEGFMKIFKNRLFQQGIYIIDEPEASLSPQSQLALILLLQNAVKRGSQIIMATHSPILMAMPDAQLMLIENHKIRKCKLEETPHFQITKGFLENPNLYLKNLTSL